MSRLLCPGILALACCLSGVLGAGENQAAAAILLQNPPDAPTVEWDRVQYRPVATEGVRTLNGTVTDLQSRHLELKLPSGSTRRINRQEIVAVQLLHHRPIAEADQAASAGKFNQAAKAYEVVMGQPVPLWLKRYAAARRVQCLRVLQQHRQALAGFVLLANHDPEQVPFEAVPVVWNSLQVDRLLESDIQKWLTSEDRWERLVAASWGLLHPPTSNASRQVMASFAEDQGPGSHSVQAIATAQLWRLTGNWSPPQIEALQKELDQFPNEVKAGPLLLLGKIRKNAGQTAEATDCFLQIATLYPEQHDLVLLALEAAYLSLRDLDPSESSDVGQWLVRQFPKSPQADEILRQVGR